MSHSILITPGGHLRLYADAEAAPPLPLAAADSLQQAFEQSSAAGLTRLASHALDDVLSGGELPPALVFWRSFARACFQALCELGEGGFGKWATVAPAEGQLERFVETAPPMRGLEYVDAPRLAQLWRELAQYAAEQAQAHAEGAVGFLHAIHPAWNLLGRVTFHLAENKRDPERPFAFLATFTHGLSRQARLKHLPLAEALKMYAGAKDRAKLEPLLEPVRRAAERSALARELLESKALFAPQAWSVKQAYRFLNESSMLSEAGVVVRVPDWWRGRRPPRPQVQVRLGTRPTAELGRDALLDFNLDVVLEGEPLTQQEVQAMLASADGLYLLKGKWVEVDRDKLQQVLDHWRRLSEEYADGVSFVQGMRLLAGAELDAPAEADASAAWTQVVAGDWLRETLRKMRDPARAAQFQPGKYLQATLRPYQADGVRWLYFLTELGLGACLADDMGLGKTIQVIDLLLQRKQSKERCSPSLLVVPASLIGNWKQELARFAPSLRPFFAHRSEVAAEEMARVAQAPQRALSECDLVVTTYQLVRREDWLQKVRWSLVILDEAQAIKNAGSAQTRAVKKLHSAARIVLTGTPVENRLGDLWSLFDFCCPGLLGTAAQFKEFVKRLNQRQDAQAYGALRRLVRPYILRRLKTDPNVVPDLPEKTEMRTECGLSKKQAVLYQRAVEQLADRLEYAEGMARRGLVLGTLMQLKQICNHPAQYLGSGDYVPSESGKFERLAALCEPIAMRQEKVLVFSQFQTLTEPLAEFLAGVFGRKGLVLHGGTSVRKRSELVQQFQRDDGPPFFVISLKAGGSGLNLTAASHVVHFDRWWNPAVENQATDRAFRIGQKRNVLVHKFVCRGTVEERIDALIASKLSLADQILNQDGEQQLTEMSDEELLQFVALDLQRAAEE